MNHLTVVIFSFSILIPALIGWVRCKKIDSAYYPFLLLLWLGLANEILNYIITNEGFSNAINSNIFVLVESFLILILFKRLGLFQRAPKLFVFVALVYLVVWIAENFIVSTITNFSSYFIGLFSFITVLMSINLINIQITTIKRQLLGNGLFLLCIGFILYYTYTVLVEVFWIYGLNASKVFRQSVYRILTYVNFVTNLIYAIAVLWMPRKREYMLL